MIKIKTPSQTLIKISPPIWPIFITELEIIKKELEQDNHVHIIACKGNKNFCIANEKMVKINCKFCQNRLINGLKILKKYHPSKIKIFFEKYNVQKLIPKNKIKFNFTYKNFKIGESIKSSLITMFKSELISEKFYKKIILELINQSLNNIVFLKKNIFNRSKYNKIYIFNGKNYNYRTLVQYCQNKKKNFFCYDYPYFSHDGYLIKKNGMTQYLMSRSYDLKKLYKKLNKQINLSKIHQNGKNFFQKRINKINTGPIPTFNILQKSGAIPKEFIKEKFKISFFNVSDFESLSIEENKKYNVYKDQVMAVEKIVQDLQKYNNLIFSLRLHPNSINEPNKVARFNNLKNKYKNLIIVDPLSKIDSYKLAQESDLIITFGSTIGLESVFLKKNVINLSASYYAAFKIDFQPKTHRECIGTIKKLIKNNIFNKKKYNLSLSIANALMHETIKLKYIKRIDFFRYKLIIKNNIYKLEKINLITILYKINYLFSIILKLVNLSYKNTDLLKFYLLNYIFRLKKILTN